MPEKNKKLARYFRSNMTLPEVLSWKRLRSEQIGFAFSRQFRTGDFVLDFYCRELRVAIEIDGQIHALRKTKDEVRDEWLAHQQIYVLRFQQSQFSPIQIKLHFRYGIS